MILYFSTLNPVIQAFLAGMFTFFITTLGSLVVVFFKSIRKTIMDIMLALAAGIMLSACFFSLLSPAIDMSEKLGLVTWLVVFLGFILGGIFLTICDRLITFYSKKKYSNLSNRKRSMMLFTSITLHNIPEGLVLGIAYGSLIYSFDDVSLVSAISLTIAIALQNFPEGSAISLPFRRDGFSRLTSFIFGSLSAIVEPIFAIIGAVLVIKIQIILPFIMSFTAGAMIFVTILELIPESLTNKRKNLMTLFIMLGFSVMMILELIL